MAPPDFSMSSLVASPTVPMIGRAKSRVGASIWLVRMESAPGIARILEPSGRSGASMRSTIARTNASLPAAATFAAYALALILTTFASRIADALALSLLTFDLSMPILNTVRSSTIAAPSSPSSSPRSGYRRRCVSRFVPSSCGCTMLGCQLVFHCPDSLDSLASVWYAQLSGTPGNVQLNDKRAVAEDRSRETDATVTLGFRGPIPLTNGLNRSLTAVPVEPTKGNGDRSLALRPAANAAAARSGVSPLESGFSLGSEIPHPASATARISSRHPYRAE